MINIKTEKESRKIAEFWKSFKTKQQEIETEDTFIYSILPIRLAIKHNLLFVDFLCHPIMLKKRKFYENLQSINTNKEIIDKIIEVLEFELTNDEKKSYLTKSTLDKLIKKHTSMTKKKPKS